MVRPGDMVLIVTYGGAILMGKVLAADDRAITLKLKWHGVATIDRSVIKEMKVFRRVGEVK
jgi:preprotein translocase subunit YajC